MERRFLKNLLNDKPLTAATPDKVIKRMMLAVEYGLQDKSILIDLDEALWMVGRDTVNTIGSLRDEIAGSSCIPYELYYVGPDNDCKGLPIAYCRASDSYTIRLRSGAEGGVSRYDIRMRFECAAFRLLCLQKLVYMSEELCAYFDQL